jgi:hypothetical protein
MPHPAPNAAGNEEDDAKMGFLSVLKVRAVLDVIATIADILADSDYSGTHIPHPLPPYILCTSANLEAL